MGLDYKVVAAVFVTLLAVAIGMKDSSSGIGGLDIDIPDSVGDILNLKDRAAIFSSGETPNTSIESSFSSGEDIEKLSISDKADVVHIKGKDALIEIGGLEADVEGVDMVFANFTGKIKLEGNLTLNGKAESMEFNALPFTASEPKKVSATVTDPVFVSVDKLRSRSMEFEEVSGSFSSGGTTITLDKEPTSITSFEGVFARNYSSEKYSMNGKVFEAVFGEGNSKTGIGG